MEAERFLFSNCTLFKDKLFFIETQTGLPAKMDPDTGEVTYCDIMDGFELIPGDLVDFIDSFEDKVYALETSGENLIIFDVFQKSCQYVALDCRYQPWGNFVAFEKYESYYYIFPRYENKILVFNTDNHEITVVANYFKSINEIQCACRMENKVWLFPKDSRVIGAYDVSNGNMEIYESGEVIENCVDAVFVNGSIYILNRFGIIYRWDISQKLSHKIVLLETEQMEEESMCRILYAGNKLIVLPALGKDIKLLDLPKQEIEIYNGYPSDFLYHEIRWSKYYGLCEDTDNYYIAMRLANYFLRICKNDGMLNWIKPKLPECQERLKIQKPLQERRLKRILQEGKTPFSERDTNIINLVKVLQSDRQVKEEVSIGNIIYEKVK